MRAVINAKIVTKSEVLEGYSLLFFKNKIIKITKELPVEVEIIDANGYYLSAGFIDIHIHGSAGFDVMDGTQKALEVISKSILQTGTTSFLATTMTMSQDDIKKSLLTVQNFKYKGGAKILGVHLEGPFINIAKKGAQNADYIQAPNFELIEPFMDIIKMVTIAPEVDWAREFIFYLKKHYPLVLLSVGHSDADYKQTKQSFDWGISHATHLFNAMNPLHHREPAIVGAVLEDDTISCDIIADLIHIHPSFFKLLYKLKKEQLILITDAMRAGCLCNGISEIGGQRVVVKDGEARLENGTLAGSVLKMNEALRNFYKYTDISMPELIGMVTHIPAKKLNLKIGELKEGYPVDLVLFDKDFNIKRCFVEGMVI
jgi:N-acetylglucosamine-6-phosphate deacetylase